MTEIGACFDIPLRSRFRAVTRRAGVLVQGPAGWGEFSPFPEYGPPQTCRWREAAEEAATRAWPPPRRTHIPVNVTIPAVAPEEAAAMVLASGCRTAKVKVGEGDDLGRVGAVRDALGPTGRIRLDVNAGWDLEEATRQIQRMAPLGLEYVEQPVARAEDMARLRRRVAVPLAADELVRMAPDPRRVRLGGVADLVVLKVQPLGGVWAALAVAEALGLPAVVSSAVETSVGLAGGLALAAALEDLPYACGLATSLLLAGDVVAEPLAPVDGFIEVRRPEPDPGRLAAWQPGEEAELDLRARWEQAAR